MQKIFQMIFRFIMTSIVSLFLATSHTPSFLSNSQTFWWAAITIGIDGA
ncbi:hypothetical protein [Chryseobacterium sp.]|nr:hypothetical protein [Chryseobacterium sp.]